MHLLRRLRERNRRSSRTDMIRHRQKNNTIAIMMAMGSTLQKLRGPDKRKARSTDKGGTKAVARTSSCLPVIDLSLGLRPFFRVGVVASLDMGGVMIEGRMNGRVARRP